MVISLTLMCRYYHNITSNTLVVLEAMAKHGVGTLIYSSTCATYGEPEKMPITEVTPQVRVNSSLTVNCKYLCFHSYVCSIIFYSGSISIILISHNLFWCIWTCIFRQLINVDESTQVPINPYGKAKKMAEDIILDFSKNSDMAVMILRLVVFVYTNFCYFDSPSSLSVYTNLCVCVHLRVLCIDFF